MTTYQFTVASTVVLLLPMLYFLIASPSFLLVGLDDPVVTRLLRSLVNVQFALVGVAAAIAAVAFAVAGRPVVGIAIGSVAVLAIAARRPFLRRLDEDIRARDAGDADAVRRLRRLHWGGMACNAIQCVAVVAGIPAVFVAAP